MRSLNPTPAEWDEVFGIIQNAGLNFAWLDLMCRPPPPNATQILQNAPPHSQSPTASSSSSNGGGGGTSSSGTNVQQQTISTVQEMVMLPNRPGIPNNHKNKHRRHYTAYQHALYAQKILGQYTNHLANNFNSFVSDMGLSMGMGGGMGGMFF